MNALITVIKDKKKIMFENEGRLLKKSFIGLIILSLAFQTGSFGEIVRQSMIDAYLQVSVFVGFTLFIFLRNIKLITIEHQKHRRLKQHLDIQVHLQWYQIVFAA